MLTPARGGRSNQVGSSTLHWLQGSSLGDAAGDLGVCGKEGGSSCLLAGCQPRGAGGDGGERRRPLRPLPSWGFPAAAAHFPAQPNSTPRSLPTSCSKGLAVNRGISPEPRTTGTAFFSPLRLRGSTAAAGVGRARAPLPGQRRSASGHFRHHSCPGTACLARHASAPRPQVPTAIRFPEELVRLKVILSEPL